PSKCRRTLIPRSPSRGSQAVRWLHCTRRLTHFAPEEEEPHVINLMDTLRQSLHKKEGASRASAAGDGKPATRRAASVRKHRRRASAKPPVSGTLDLNG